MDDKTIAGAVEKEIPLAEFTRHWIDLFHEDLEALSIKPAEAYPKVSDHVDKMVSLTEELLKKGVAYEKLRSIYFDISQIGNYGTMSGVDLEKIRLGATVDLDEYEKDNPRDFTLFKRTRSHERDMGVSISTRWGFVRPSLHVQCAAISMAYLGGGFDIHTSSRALLFPHHENEEAIAQGLTGGPLARFWLHCDRVLSHGRKMDIKGDRVTMEEIHALGYDGRVLRYWLLSGHYGKSLNYSPDRLREAAKALSKIDACVKSLMEREHGRPYADLDQVVYDIRRGLIDAMDDDLNVSRGLAVIFRAVRKINALMGEGWIDGDGALELLKILRDVDQVLGIFDFSEKKGRLSHEVAELLAERDDARKRGEWQEADALRGRIESFGVTVRDIPMKRPMAGSSTKYPYI